MKYHRFCSSGVSPYTNRKYGIFVSVWHLIRDGKVTADEEAAYWEHRRWYEAHLPVPPYYEAGNPQKAITWFKQSALDHPILERLTFYHSLAEKYGIVIGRETTESPGEIIYEDDFQIAAVPVD